MTWRAISARPYTLGIFDEICLSMEGMEDIRGKMGDAAAMGVAGDAMPTPSANEAGIVSARAKIKEILEENFSGPMVGRVIGTCLWARRNRREMRGGIP
jgi:hypothetical protein